MNPSPILHLPGMLHTALLLLLTLHFLQSEATLPAFCPGGCYCPDSMSQITCPAGKYCPAGSTSPQDCPTAMYSLPGSPMCAYHGNPTIASLGTGAQSINHMCALWTSSDAPPVVSCWGSNSNGEQAYVYPLETYYRERGLVQGDMGNNLPSLPLSSEFNLSPKKMALGWHNTHVLLGDSVILGWGSIGARYYGSTQAVTRRGSGNFQGLTVNLPSNSLVADITISGEQGCALFTDKTVACWGANDRGQLGIGSTVEWKKAQKITLPNRCTVAKVVTGDCASCVLCTSAEVFCWGCDSEGVLGFRSRWYINDFDDEVIPHVGDQSNEMGENLRSAIHPFNAVTSIAANTGSVCVLSASGEVACWGGGYSGPGWDVGSCAGYSASISKPLYWIQGNEVGCNGASAPVRMPDGFKVVNVAMGGGHVCVVFHNGKAGCWGSNDFGQLGLGHTQFVSANSGTMGNNMQLVQLPTGTTAIGIYCQMFSTCALLSDRSVVCWGSGALGNGMNTAVGEFFEPNVMIGDQPNEMGDHLVRIPFPTQGGPGLYWNGVIFDTCQAGTYSVAGVPICIPCTPGTYSAAGVSVCTPCAAGTHSPGASSHCISCTPGNYISPQGACTPCAAGDYSTSTTTLACNPCPSGSYSPSGSSQCTSCPSGTYITSQGACTPCAVGFYSASSGSLSCTRCPAGTYSSSGSSRCNACTPGTYATFGAPCTACAVNTYSTAGVSVCTPCAEGLSSPTGASVCLCPTTHYAIQGSAGLMDNCVECPTHSSTAPGISVGFSTCACNAGYKGINTGTSLPCTVCPAGRNSLWNSSTCTACEYGKYAREGWENCIQCSIPDPDPVGSWRYIAMEGATEATCGGFVCQGNTAETFDHYCLTSTQITQRCSQHCQVGTYSVNCGQAGNGTCAACTSVCPSGQYNTGCGGVGSGTCHQCTPDAAKCDPGSFLSECGGDRWPQTTGTCTYCMFHCSSNTTQYTDDCTATTRGTCKACASVCPTGQYSTGCGGVNQNGTCTTCNYCNSTSYAKGCGGISKGECTPCGADCSSSPPHYARGCGGISPGDCQTCGQGAPQFGYTTGCALNSPGNSFVCANTCTQGQYANGCGGFSAGVCTNCVNTAGPGYYFWGCEKDTAGSAVPCPVNTYRAASGGTHLDNCTGCRTGSDTNGATGSTGCTCQAGTYMESQVGPVCTTCPIGYYQELRGQTVCNKCPRGRFRVSGAASSYSNCQACADGNKPATGAVWKDEVYLDSGCTWECTPPYEKRTVNRRDDCVLPANTPSSTATVAQQQGGTTVAQGGRQSTPTPNSPNSPNSPNAPNAPGASTTSTTPTPQNTSQTNPSAPAVNIGLIVGLVVGGVVLLVVVLIAFLTYANGEDPHTDHRV